MDNIRFKTCKHGFIYKECTTCQMFTLLFIQNQNEKLWLPTDINIKILNMLDEMTTKDVMSKLEDLETEVSETYTCISCLAETTEEIYIIQLDSKIVFWKYNKGPSFEEYRFQHSVSKEDFENKYGHFWYNSNLCFHCLNRFILTEKLHLYNIQI